MMRAIAARAGWFIAALLALMLVGAMPERAMGGPLDPTAPPSSTLPLVEPRIPISQVPFTASAEGSYFLTGDLTMAAPGFGITVTSNRVTIDLNGFTLRGAGAANAYAGVLTNNGHTETTIRNGVIEEFGEGIETSAGYSTRVERVTVRGYSATGIVVGASSVIEGCIVDGGVTGSGGILVGVRSVVRHCTVVNAQYSGILAATNALIEGNQILNNDRGDLGAGVLVTDNDVVVRDNYLSNAGNHDVLVQQGKRATIIDNVLSACNAINTAGAGFVFAPMQGQRHSNVTHSAGYCP